MMRSQHSIKVYKRLSVTRFVEEPRQIASGGTLSAFAPRLVIVPSTGRA